jgi:hypothetical protein
MDNDGIFARELTLLPEKKYVRKINNQFFPKLFAQKKHVRKINDGIWKNLI